MSWNELKIDTSVQHLEMLSETLTDFGAAAITFIDAKNQPIYEPPPGETPFWENTTIVGLFAADTDTEEIIHHIRALHGDKIITSWVSEPLKEQVWETAWMEHFEPTRFGDRLWVCPSWKDIPDPDAVNILLDPGLAFGTGTHPTTALCLEALDRYPLENRHVVDYGCGSGILAIAAIKLGADHALCVDNDPQALIATEENAGKNQVLDSMDILPPDAVDDSNDTRADLLIANILANPLIKLLPHFIKLLKEDGDIILSGILADQEQDIIQAYSGWFDIQEISRSDNWLCIQAKRSSATHEDSL